MALGPAAQVHDSQMHTEIYGLLDPLDDHAAPGGASLRPHLSHRDRTVSILEYLCSMPPPPYAFASYYPTQLPPRTSLSAFLLCSQVFPSVFDGSERFHASDVVSDAFGRSSARVVPARRPWRSSSSG